MWLEDVLRKNWKISAAAGTLVIIIIMAAILYSSLNPLGGVTPASDVISPTPDGMKQVQGSPITFNGQTEEKKETPTEINITQMNVSYVKVTLWWQDEDDKPLMKNQPDEFKLKVTAPNNKTNETAMVKNLPDTKKGEVSLTIGFPSETYPNKDGTGKWKITVVAGDCGDQAGMFFGLRKSADTGNSWTVTTNYIYLIANNTK